MSRQLQAITKKKSKPLLHKILSEPSEINLINRFKGDYCKCKNSSHVLENNHHIMYKDRMKILMCNCSNYKAYLQKCSSHGKEKNIYLNSKAVYQQKHQYYETKNDSHESTRKNNELLLGENKEEYLALTSGFLNIDSKELKKIS